MGKCFLFLFRSSSGYFFSSSSSSICCSFHFLPSSRYCVAFISYYSNPKSDFMKWKDLLSLVLLIPTNLSRSLALAMLKLHCEFSTTSCCLYRRIKVWMAINLSPEFPTRLRQRRWRRLIFQCNNVWQTSILLWNENNINTFRYFQSSLEGKGRRENVECKNTHDNLKLTFGTCSS